MVALFGGGAFGAALELGDTLLRVKNSSDADIFGWASDG